MDWIEALSFAFLAGALTKYSDVEKNCIASLVAAFLAGIIHVYLSVTHPYLSAVIAGTSIGVLIAGKVDKLSHAVNAVISSLTVVLGGPVHIFSLFSSIDELTKTRPFLPLAVIIYSLMEKNIVIAGIFLAWDSAYRFMGILAENSSKVRVS